MALVRKCPKCSLELADPSASICPLCGTTLIAQAKPGIWWAALFPLAAATPFMLVFKFPKWMIVAFGVMALIGTIVSLKMKQAHGVTRPVPPKPVARPVLFRVVSLAIAVCALSFFSIALFSFVIFMNAWMRWHRYEGHPFHRAEFEVTRTYFQKGSRGSVSIYARGLVEGQKEWMDLERYVGTPVRSQEELDEHVGAGTSIPIYLFPDLKGRVRVQLASDPPPAESGRQQAMNAASHGLTGLAITAALMFVLFRVRGLCYAPAAGVTASL